MKNDMTSISNLIHERSGLVFRGDQENALIKALEERMGANQINSLAKYNKRLLASQDEFNQLLDLLTINETYFFREPTHFKLVTDELIPKLLLQKKTGEKIKILCAGCSNGAEPYSLVMALVEKYGLGIHKIFSIIGLDIDSRIIQAAKIGIYTGFSFRVYEKEIKSKYFELLGTDFYKLSKFIRDRVDFYQVNLLNEPFPPEASKTDIIFYRNVSIYFKEENRKKVFRNLANILNENGYLILSSTETMLHDFKHLALIQRMGTFLFQKSDLSEDQTKTAFQVADPFPAVTLNDREYDRSPLSHSSSSPQPKEPLEYDAAIQPETKNNEISRLPEAISPSEASYEKALIMAKNKSYDAALAEIEALGQTGGAILKAFLLKANIQINLKEFKKAKKTCYSVLNIDDLSMEAYLLLGLIDKFESHPDQAVIKFKKAIYLDSSFWMPHYYIAELYQANGSTKLAKREYQIVLNLLEKGSFDDHQLEYFSFTFSETQIRNLCHYNLGKLDDQE